MCSSDLVSQIYEYFLVEKKTEDFGYKEILRYLEGHPQVMELNKKYQRNEGLQKSINEDILVTPN